MQSRSEPGLEARRTAMIKRLSTALAIVCVMASAAIATAAGTLTDAMQASRMTVVKVDRTASRFLCAEHQRWTAVAPADLTAVNQGDIVRVARGQGPARLTVVRTAADEIATPQN